MIDIKSALVLEVYLLILSFVEFMNTTDNFKKVLSGNFENENLWNYIDIEIWMILILKLK